MLIMRGDSKTGSLLFLVVPLYISKPREAMRTTWEDAKSKILKFIKIRIILMTYSNERGGYYDYVSCCATLVLYLLLLGPLRLLPVLVEPRKTVAVAAGIN